MEIGEDDVDALVPAPTGVGAGEGVVVADEPGVLDVVEEHVGNAEQVRHPLLFDGAEVLLHPLLVGHLFYVALPHVGEGAGEEPAGPAPKATALPVLTKAVNVPNQLDAVRSAAMVGIIRHGKLVAVEIVSELRSKAIRRIELDFSTPVEAAVFEAVPGVSEVLVEDHRVVLSYDGKIEVLLRVVMDRYDLLDIHTQEADLEEIGLLMAGC